jgi:hypothetical protein
MAKKLLQCLLLTNRVSNISSDQFVNEDLENFIHNRSFKYAHKKQFHKHVFLCSELKPKHCTVLCLPSSTETVDFMKGHNICTFCGIQVTQLATDYGAREHH